MEKEKKKDNTKEEIDTRQGIWKGLFNWSLQHQDSQGDPTKSAFYGKSKEEIAKEAEFLKKAIDSRTFNVGERLRDRLKEICNKYDPEIPKEKRLEMKEVERTRQMQILFEIEDFVENIDHADTFFRINGLEKLYTCIISNEEFKSEDIKIYCIKIIAVCMFNVSQNVVKFDTAGKLYHLVTKKLKFYSEIEDKNTKKNIDFMRTLLYSLTSFVSGNIRDKSKKGCTELVIKNDIPLLFKILETFKDFNIKSKVLHLLLTLLINQENDGGRSDLAIKLIFDLKIYTDVLKPQITKYIDLCFKNIDKDLQKNLIIFEKLIGLSFELIRKDTKKDKKDIKKIRDYFIKEKYIEFMETINKTIATQKDEHEDLLRWIVKISKEMDRNVCNYCKRIQTQEEQVFKWCSRCKSVNYCSVECQKKDWPKHKLVCKPKQ